MIQGFKAYELAVGFFKSVKGLEMPGYTRDQLLRAAQSIVLNLAEGHGKPTQKDQKRFFAIAFGSIREVQAVFDLIEMKDAVLADKLDHLAASVYRLTFR